MKTSFGWLVNKWKQFGSCSINQQDCNHLGFFRQGRPLPDVGRDSFSLLQTLDQLDVFRYITYCRVHMAISSNAQATRSSLSSALLNKSFSSECRQTLWVMGGLIDATGWYSRHCTLISMSRSAVNCNQHDIMTPVDVSYPKMMQYLSAAGMLFTSSDMHAISSSHLLQWPACTVYCPLAPSS